MTLSDLSIRRPVFAWMLMYALMIFGVICFSRMGVSMLPDATQPILTINVNWTGAAPELMETEIVNHIEEAVISVQGLKNIESNIRQGTANVKLEFYYDRNIDAALQETNAKLRTVQLPSDVDPPTIIKQNTDDNPIMWLSVTGKRSFHDLISYIDLNLRDRFQVIPGVGNVILGGWADRNFRVWVDNDKLAKYQLTILDVEKTLELENNEVASGYFENAKSEQNVRTMGEAVTAEQMGAMLITQRADKQIYNTTIRLRDIARVEDGLDDIRRVSRSNGMISIGLGVQKQRGFNEIEVGNNIKKFVEDVNKTLPPDMHVDINYDGTIFTKASVHETELTLFLSAVATGLVCWAFLGSWRSTFNVLIAIPTSVLGSFIVLYFLGFTINSFTLLGLSLAIGIVVDDAIMVLENIVRHFHAGKSSRQAALDGAREITFAATAATLAVVAIFLPVFLLNGIQGIFLFQFGVTISTAVGLSLLEAITLTPMRCARFMTAKDDENRFARWVNRMFEKCAAYYAKALVLTLQHRWKVIGISLALFALSLVPLFTKGIGFEFLPAQDSGLILLRFQTPVGSSLPFTGSKALEIEKFLQSQPYVDHYFINAGGFGGGEVNTGISFVSLVPRNKRDIGQPAVMTRFRTELNKIKDLEVFVLDPLSGNFSPKRGTTLEMSVRGSDYKVLHEKVDEMIKRYKASGLMTDIDTDFREGAPEVRVIPDREKAALSNVSMKTISGTINAAIGGVRQGKYTNGDRRYDVRMRLEPEQWRVPEDVEKLMVRTSYGEMIPLSVVTKTEVVPTLLTITREMRERSITVYANAEPGKTQAEVLTFALKTADEVLPEGYRALLTGASQTAKESFQGFGFALLMGIIISYMVLGIQFNSFVHPITVLTNTFVFSFTGGLLGLFVTRNTFNMYSGIGLLLLMGIVKKNSILLVEFFNRKRFGEHLSLNDAIIQGGPIRLRPIFMTSAATAAAALPAALGIGPGAEVRVPLAVVVISGVIVATFFTLITVPCVYSLLSNFESKRAGSQALSYGGGSEPVVVTPALGTGMAAS